MHCGGRAVVMVQFSGGGSGSPKCFDKRLIFGKENARSSGNGRN
jgi:hypothetical protein